MKHSTTKPTAVEQARLDALHAMPCMACVKERCAQPSKTEVHHLVDKGYRIHSGGHMATIPLCAWHHRGELDYPLTRSEMHVIYGPSLASSKREFVATYGNERKLLAEVNEQLQMEQVA